MKIGFLTIAVSMLLLSAMNVAHSQPLSKQQTGVARCLTNDQFDYISINNILLWMSNDGCMGHNPQTDASGLMWPKGSARSAIFQEGIVYGGLLKNKVYVGGSTYRQALQAGPIKSDGTAADVSDSRYRIYKVTNVRQAEFDTMSADSKAALRRDFTEWPVADGARFIDSNHNGIYDPDFDAWLADSTTSDKPWFVGDEVMWFVSNDLDAKRTSNLYGSAPMHLEVQTMVWANKSGHPRENAVFIKHTFINKGTDNITDFYIGKWTDVDLGDCLDDFVGIDTALGMAYVYNGNTRDNVYNIPPALGYVPVQPPIAPSPGDVALYNFGKRSGYRNVPASSFAFYINSSPVYTDPDLGIYQGALMMYNNMKGLRWSGEHFIDPVTGLSTPITLAGDPVTGQGWIDGIVAPAGDRRMLVSFGPVQLAVGDTQEVVFATLLSQGGTNLQSIEELRHDALILKTIMDVLPADVEVPDISYKVSYPGPNAAHVDLTAASQKAVTLSGVLRKKNREILTTFPLYDDGLHGDGAAGDRLFGGGWDTIRVLEGVDCSVLCTYSEDIQHEWPAGHCIPLAGPVHDRLYKIESDHLNYDGIANPGENIRFSVELDNQTPFAIGSWLVTPSLDIPGLALRLSVPSLIPAFQQDHSRYDPVNQSTYITYDIPSSSVDGDVLLMPTVISDENYNIWKDTIRIDVKGYAIPPTDSLMIHIAGPATGKLGWRVADRSALKDHTYMVTVSGQYDPEGYESLKSLTFTDLTSQSVLLNGGMFPDVYAHNMPLVDGWKATQGTASYELEFTATYYPADHHWLRMQSPWEPAFLSWGSSVGLYDLVPVKLVFDEANTQNAYCYMHGGTPNYGCVGYYEVPLRAYDMSDTSNPRQLNIAFVEQRGTATEDHTWMPDANASSREYLYIFKSTYSPSPDQFYLQKKINSDSHNMDILYHCWPFRESSTLRFQNGDYYTLQSTIPISYRDTFLVNPIGLVNGIYRPPLADRISLEQNYPNPFGSASIASTFRTMVPFDLPNRDHVALEVFDMLGRHVQTLFDGVLDAGHYDVPFTAPSSLPTGSYMAVLTTSKHRLAVTMAFIR